MNFIQQKYILNNLKSILKFKLLTGDQVNSDNVTNLDTTDRELKLCYKKFLHILKRKPESNEQLNSQSNYEVKTLIINS